MICHMWVPVGRAVRGTSHGKVIYLKADLSDVHAQRGSRVSPISPVIADKTRGSENEDARSVLVVIQLGLNCHLQYCCDTSDSYFVYRVFQIYLTNLVILFNSLFLI